MFQHVQFGGAWTEAEREQVAKAINTYEDTKPARYIMIGPPWVCSKEEVGDRDYFFLAWRVGNERVLIGRSPAELAEKIRALCCRVPSE